MKPSAVILLAALAAGCYESSSGREDASVDPAPDPVPDPVDSLPDPVPDPADSLPDPIHDTAVDDGMDPYPDCQASLGITVSYEIDPIPPEYDYEAACTIASFWLSDDQTEIMLDLACMGPDGSLDRWSISIHASVGIPLYLAEDQDVVFAKTMNFPMYANHWFALYTPERQLLLAGLAADYLAPHEYVPSEWYMPLDVSEAAGLCPMEPNPCSNDERIALDISSDGMTARVFDGNMGLVGMWQVYLVVVDTAVRYNDLQCVDTPPKWFSAVIAALPSM